MIQESLALLLASALFGGAAAAQPATAPAPVVPAQSTTKPPQLPENKPVLNLRLDDRELRSAASYTPNESSKKPATAESLPGLGGSPSESWNQPATPSRVIPPSSPY
jgi:hypothetical protein